MKFKFDEQGHVVWSPKELYQMVLENPSVSSTTT